MGVLVIFCWGNYISVAGDGAGGVTKGLIVRQVCAYAL